MAMSNVKTPELTPKDFNDEEIEMGSLNPEEGMKHIEEEAGEESEENGTTFAAPTPIHPPVTIKLRLDKPTPALDEKKLEEATNEEEVEEEAKKPKKPRVTRKNQRKEPEPKSIKEAHDAEKKKKRSNNSVKSEVPPRVSESIADKIGSVEALPAKYEGKAIHYLGNKEGPTPLPRAVKLTELPTNSFIVVPRWRKIEGHFGPCYILEVEDDPSKAYWSNSRVNAIIGGGMVNPETQVLTIHRLLDGSFIYGYAEKK